MKDFIKNQEPETKRVRRVAMPEHIDAIGHPLYKTIKLEITRRLSGGEWSPGEALPTEKALATHFGVSIGTVRRAMDELVAEHIVVRQQGRGTFLREFSHDLMLNHFWRVTRHDGSREIPIVQTLSFERQTPDPDVSKQLDLRARAEVFKVVNLLLLGGRRIMLDEVHLPCSQFPSLTHEMLVAREGTMFSLYRDEFSIIVICTDERLLAVTADRDAAKILDVPVGTPLIKNIRLSFTFDKHPVELRKSLLLTDGYEYRHSVGGSTMV
jgi:GntR family transcriptional regulator